MQFGPDQPIGAPSFDLHGDEIETVVDLVCSAAKAARSHLTQGMLEVPITILVRKTMRSIKKERGLTNLEVRGEHELENMVTIDPSLLGRIDISLKFRRQFGDEDDYVGVECKRVGAGATYSSLNGNYVVEGVDRFVVEKYGAGHTWGFMLGFVLAVPIQKLLATIDKKLEKTYGEFSKFRDAVQHPAALAVRDSDHIQNSGTLIRLRHMFIDMTPAAPSGKQRGRYP